MVGAGTTLKKNTLLDVTVQSAQQYKKGGVAFKTGPGIEGVWRVTDMGRKCLVQTSFTDVQRSKALR